MGNRGAATAERNATDRHSLIGASILVGKIGHMVASIERQSGRHGQLTTEAGQSSARRTVINLRGNRTVQIDRHVRCQLNGIIDVGGEIRRGAIAVRVVIDADGACTTYEVNIAMNGAQVIKDDRAHAPGAIVGPQHDIPAPLSLDPAAKIVE